MREIFHVSIYWSFSYILSQGSPYLLTCSLRGDYLCVKCKSQVSRLWLEFLQFSNNIFFLIDYWCRFDTILEPIFATLWTQFFLAPVSIACKRLPPTFPWLLELLAFHYQKYITFKDASRCNMPSFELFFHFFKSFLLCPSCCENLQFCFGFIPGQKLLLSLPAAWPPHAGLLSISKPQF